MRDPHANQQSVKPESRVATDFSLEFPQRPSPHDTGNVATLKADIAMEEDETRLRIDSDGNSFSVATLPTSPPSPHDKVRAHRCGSGASSIKSDDASVVVSDTVLSDPVLSDDFKSAEESLEDHECTTKSYSYTGSSRKQTEVQKQRDMPQTSDSGVRSDNLPSVHQKRVELPVIERKEVSLPGVKKLPPERDYGSDSLLSPTQKKIEMPLPGKQEAVLAEELLLPDSGYSDSQLFPSQKKQTEASARQKLKSLPLSQDTSDSGIHSESLFSPTKVEIPLTEKQERLPSNVKTLCDAIMKANVPSVRDCLHKSAVLLNQVIEPQTGYRPIHLTAKHGHKAVCELLLQRKASVIVMDSAGCTPLHVAASYGNYEIAKLILSSPDHGIIIHATTKDGTPLLLDPASKGFSMICELLLEHGADPLMETRAGVSPLYIASDNGHKDVVRTLLKFGADPTRICRKTSRTSLQAAIDGGYIEVMKLLMKALADIDKRNDALFKCKTVEEIQKAVKNRANVNAQKADGSTPLIVHVATGNKEVVQELIGQGANVDVQDNEGWSALMMAARNGELEIIQILITAGAVPDLKNKEGLTALMCATLSGHVNVVKELLLAKADPNLKIKNGRSALEIAEQQGKKELVAVMKRHTMSAATSGNDPLFGLLGSYLELKRQAGSQRKAAKKTVKRREASSLLLPRQPLAQTDEASSLRQELNTKYKRIAELETRIHDLTLQQHMVPPEDSDLSYLERKRLEDEFRKLKDLKRKAEAYAIEAKQTAQRLSAENSKLRDDLSRERKLNDVTRSNIIRELEERSNRDALTGEKTAIESKAYEEKVKSQAYALSKASPHIRVKQVELTAKDIKEVIFKQSFKVNLPRLVITGKAGCGKTTIMNRILNLSTPSSELVVRCGTDSASMLRDDDLPGAIVLHNELCESRVAIDSADGDSSSLQRSSLVFAQSLVRAHSTLSFADESSLIQTGIFSNPMVDKHFAELAANVKTVTRQLQNKGYLGSLSRSQLSFVDIANTGTSKTANGIFYALTAKCREHLLILNLLNLERDTPEKLTIPPNFYDSGSPDESSRPANLSKFKDALQSIKHSAHMVSSCSKPRVLVVGTHKDKLSERRLSEAKSNLKQVIMSYAEDAGVVEAVCPRIQFINAKDAKDYKHVQDYVVQMIQNGEEFQVDIPVKFIFFQSYLQTTNRMFISRKRLIEEACKCDITDEEEIEQFLTVFSACGSIMYSSDGEIPTLKDYIIIHPNTFIKALDKLHSSELESMDKAPELMQDAYAMKSGFLSKRLASYLWPEDGEGKMTQANFIISLLKDIKLLLPKSSLHLESNSSKVETGKTEYFLPTLRPERAATEVTPDSSSLFLAYHNAVLPFSVVTDILLQLQNRLGKDLTFEPKPYYNALSFKWLDSQERRDAEVAINFTKEHVEVAVTFPTQAPRISTATKLFSRLKTAMVEIFDRLFVQIKGLEFDLAVVCPASLDSSTKMAPSSQAAFKPVHYVTFTQLTSENKKLACQTCKGDVPFEKFPWARQLWTQVAYNGTRIYSEGHLPSDHIRTLARDLATRHSHDTLHKLVEKLGFSSEDLPKNYLQETMEDLLYQLLFTWQRRNPVNSAKILASVLPSIGCFQEAIGLDPELLYMEHRSGGEIQN